MKKQVAILFIILFIQLVVKAQDFSITDVYVKKNNELNQLIFTIEVAGLAGDSTPTPIGSLDGAPVLGYVFPTTLDALDVGFDSTSGIVALALTSHPDFDDTPLWDENLDGDYANDGVEWHAHWVLLVSDTTVSGGLAVKATSGTTILPPTNPGMPMYMDSPGFSVITKGNKISCTVPLSRINNKVAFNYDGVTALMYVNTSSTILPMLGVYTIFSVASGNLSLPYSVGNHSCDTLFIDVSGATGLGLISPERISIYPNPASTNVQLEMSAGFNLGSYAIQISNMNGSIVYQTTIAQPTLSIPVSNIGSSGVYTINIIDSVSGDLKGTKKLILN
ncbi:T9SS type A sorting domain-containing protein [Aureispira anguillae]|uniref:T9SS type A sorting domain-containing protein n=1 Tax=Aureispira anguillae TaxID=2864201 RepID=A0A916DVP3_9BACT|nr:T9SS type A sorting domain-containing protein [Aureispira anguillae]BDS15354.1 T9SS type A sorting domain-containing protein [Aureispira anguillae]